MKRFVFISSLLIASLYACQTGNNRPVPASRSIPEPDLIERLKYQKAAIDTLYDRSRDKIEVLIKLNDSSRLVPFKDSILPDETEVSYFVLRDSLHHIVQITESPYSQSGDWYITLTHYFDPAGKTFSFVRHTNFFNSECTEGVAYETKTEFYNDAFQFVGRDYRLEDEKGESLPKDSCNFLYEYEYKVFPALSQYLKAKKIPEKR